MKNNSRIGQQVFLPDAPERLGVVVDRNDVDTGSHYLVEWSDHTESSHAWRELQATDIRLPPG